MKGLNVSSCPYYNKSKRYIVVLLRFADYSALLEGVRFRFSLPCFFSCKNTFQYRAFPPYSLISAISSAADATGYRVHGVRACLREPETDQGIWSSHPLFTSSSPGDSSTLIPSTHKRLCCTWRWWCQRWWGSSSSCCFPSSGVYETTLG